MLRCAASFVIAAYFYVHLIPHDLRALPANFLRNHHTFGVTATFYGTITIHIPKLLNYKNKRKKRQG